ncbi:MAG: DUF3047 domain-containing protein, partial [Myxococcota bacterium]
SALSWKWRVRKFPEGGNETIPGRMDSAASVYVYFKSGVREYVIKYVWSVSLDKGKTFETADSNYFKKMQLVVQEGVPAVAGQWRTEEVNLTSDFRRFFRDGKADGEVPPIAGIGILTDGDGTMKPSEADYAGFQLIE